MELLGETSFRILDTLARDLGKPSSINELTKSIKRLYKTAHYKNIYDKTQELEKKGYLRTTTIGRASIVSLDFSNYLLTDLLTGMELKKKYTFLEKRIEMQELLQEIETLFRQDSVSIESISLVNAERNIKLNRAEFLFILKEKKADNMSVLTYMQELENAHNIKIDCLILAENEFISMLGDKEINPPKEMLSDHITFYSPQAFWTRMRIALAKGTPIKTCREETNPAKISEQDLTYNLSRFGYTEMGTDIKRGRKICIEYIITSVLLKDDARKIGAIPVLLAKNRANHDLLVFLAKKYKKSENLLGLLEALDKIKGNEGTRCAIKTLKAIGTRTKRVDEKSIRQKMRLYNAI